MATHFEHALSYLRDGMTIGLGTGRAASSFIEALGKRVAQGLKVRGVPTSQASAELARGVGISLVSLDEAPALDLAIDGADEVDPQLNLIKGFGGALVREKIVASAARQFIVLVGEDKLVSRLGQRGRVPVEVIPFGLGVCRRKLEELGFVVEVRQHEGKPFISDNGNLVLDCKHATWNELPSLAGQIKAIPGVVDSGFFLGMADLVLVQSGDRVVEMRRQ